MGREHGVQPEAGLGSSVVHYHFGHLASSPTYNDGPRYQLDEGNARQWGKAAIIHLSCHDQHSASVILVSVGHLESGVSLPLYGR